MENLGVTLFARPEQQSKSDIWLDFSVMSQAEVYKEWCKLGTDNYISSSVSCCELSEQYVSDMLMQKKKPPVYVRCHNPDLP